MAGIYRRLLVRIDASPEAVLDEVVPAGLGEGMVATRALAGVTP